MNSKNVFFGILGAAVAIPLAGSVVSGSWRADTIEGAENGVLASGEIAIDTSHFPDKEFREYVKTFDTSKDGKLSTKERNAVVEMQCVEKGIRSVKGIEYFTLLERLDISKNEVADLDVSKNTKLYFLDCSGNQIKDLDLSKNTVLGELRCWGEYEVYGESFGTLRTIDVSKCENLYFLEVQGNQLHDLDISHNTNLSYLNCDHNSISKIDVSKIEFLENFYCGNNQLTSLDVSHNSYLMTLDFENNGIESIDVSNCPRLEGIWAEYTKLSSIDVSKNPRLRSLTIQGTKIQTVDICETVLNNVFDPSKAEDMGDHYWFNSVNEGLSYNLSYNKSTKVKYVKKPDVICKIDKNTFPDDLFREYVSQFDTNRDGKFQRAEVAGISRIELIEEKWQPVTSVKGIEYFYNLDSVQLDYTEVKEVILGEHKALYTVAISGEGDLDTGITRGNLAKLDVSKCPNLKYLHLVYNPIQNVDLSNNPNLRYVYITGCSLNKIDLSHNPGITELTLMGTEIKSLDLSANTKITDLTLDGSKKIRKIDLSKLTKLQSLSCGWMEMPKLDLSHNPELTYLFLYATGLEGLDVRSNPKLEYLDCGMNSIAKLDLRNNPELLNFICTFCQLESVNLSKNTKLEKIDVRGNLLEELDVTNMPNLTSLDCYLNPIKKLDVTNCTKLQYLDCCSDQIEKLDVSKCTKLEYLDCSANLLTALDVSKNTRLKVLNCAYNEAIKKLDLSSLDLEVLDCSQLSIPPLDLSKQTNLTELHMDSLNLKTLDLTKNKKIVILSLANNLLSELDLSHQGTFEFIDLRLNMFAKKPKYKVGGEEQFEPQKYVAPVTGLKLVSRTGTEISLAWDEAKDYGKADQYDVYRCETKDGEYELIGRVARNAKVDENTESGKTYYYYVVGVRDLSEYPYIDDYYSEPSAILEVKENTSPEDPSFEDFVERLYTVALGRASEPEGKAFWIKQVVEEGKTGADCARFFLLDADEFMKRNPSIEDFVETLYATFFDRESDAAGKKGWVEAISSGKKSRAEVVNDFIESTEWCDVCATYGVKSGAQWHKATKASKNSINFATRLYTCCLKRDPEEGGIKYWSLALTNLEQTGASAAQFFFEGDEFVGFNTSDREYLLRLYTTFMDREPSEEEIGFWIGEMKAGKQNRHSILAFFAQSPEFSGICKKYGIDRGEIG